MMNKWITEMGQRAGRNEASIEMFKKGGDGAIASLIREDIQNSLDAVKDKSKPVKVLIETKYVNKIPGQDGLNEIFTEIKKSKAWGNAYDKDIANIQEILKETKIPVLRIGDFNTKGAEGASTYNKFGNSNWIALTEVNGQTKKDSASSAGSFGIGKNANMAMSPLRTIYFTSKVEKDASAYSQGKMTYASIVSEEKNKTTGNSYFYKKVDSVSSDNSDLQIIDGFPVKGNLEEFVNFGKRSVSGTDIFIPGVDLNDTSYENIINALLSNFLVSIYQNRLEVEINLVDENKSYINNRVLEKIVNQSKNPEFKNYYGALVQSDPKYIFEMEKLTNRKGNIISDVGDVKFVVYQSDSIKGTRKAMLTRGIGMKIDNYPQRGNGFPQGIDFTAILMVTGEAPNELLHKVENPEHTSWNNKDKLKEVPDARVLIQSLKKFMRRSITKLLPKTSDEIEAYGLDELLSDNEMDSKIDDKLPTSIHNIEIKKTFKSGIRKAPIGSSGSKGNNQGVSGSNGQSANNKSKDKKDSGQQRKTTSAGGKGNDVIDVTPYIESMRSKKVKDGYAISLRSIKKIKDPKLIFEIVGDSSTDTKFNISGVEFSDQKFEVKIDNNSIEFRNSDVFKANTPISFTLKTDIESITAFNVKVLGKRENSNEN